MHGASRTVDSWPTIGVLGAVERSAWHAQMACAPSGHLVVGPVEGRGWRWWCASCGRRWHDGTHNSAPPPEIAMKPKDAVRRENDSPWWLDR